MRKTLITACLAVFAVFCVRFLPAAGAEELTSMQVKKIKDAIAKVESPERGTQRKGYREIKDLGEATIPYMAEELKEKEVGFEAKTLMCDLLGEMKAKEAVPEIVYTLKGLSPTVRASASKALGLIGDPQAVDPLLNMLNDETPQVRAAAVWALISFDDKRIPPEAAKLLGDADESVRLNAATLLSEKLDPSTSAALRAAFPSEKAGAVRIMTAKALGGIKDAQAVDILMNGVTEDQAEGVRRECAIALGKIGDKKAVPALIEGVKDDYKDVQIEAAAALKKITGQDFDRDYEKWSSWYKSSAGK